MCGQAEPNLTEDKPQQAHFEAVVNMGPAFKRQVKAANEAAAAHADTLDGMLDQMAGLIIRMKEKLKNDSGQT